MTKFYILLMMFMAFSVTAQEQPVIHETYPDGQEFYSGGKAQLYRDISRLLLDQKFTRCDGPAQTYTASVLVRPDSRVGFIKDFDSVGIATNKCAYDLFRAVLPHLKGWKPASVDGNKVHAIVEVRFVPNMLFKDYDPGYTGEAVSTLPEFPGGITAFRNEFISIFNSDAIQSGTGLVNIELKFVINEKGEMEAMEVTEGNSWDLAKEAVRTLKEMKSRWKPATLDDQPVKYRVRLPVAMNL